MSIPQTNQVRFAEHFNSIVANVGQAIFGKSEVLELAVTCLLAEGHLLIEDVPGVGKTSLAKALAISVQADYGRIQCTPDLLPSDVVGTTIWNRATNNLEFQPGPVFAGIVVADEINRASPKTQAALLEAMAERQVTVDRTTHLLPRPFMVIATQNPLEHEGTYLLPESQLDRFMMKIPVGYPSTQAELDILDTHGTHNPINALSYVVEPETITYLAKQTCGIYVAPSINNYLVQIATATRNHPSCVAGISTRATLALQRTSRVWAASRDRNFVLPDDVKRLAGPVLAHRLLFDTPTHPQDDLAHEVITEVLGSVPVPTD